MIYVVVNGKQIVKVFDGDVDSIPKLGKGESIKKKGDLVGDEIPLASDGKTSIERKLLSASSVDISDDDHPDTWDCSRSGDTALILLHINEWIQDGKLKLDSNIKIITSDGSSRSITIRRFKRLAEQQALRVLRQLQ